MNTKPKKYFFIISKIFGWHYRKVNDQRVKQKMKPNFRSLSLKPVFAIVSCFGKVKKLALVVLYNNVRQKQ